MGIRSFIDRLLGRAAPASLAAAPLEDDAVPVAPARPPPPTVPVVEPVGPRRAPAEEVRDALASLARGVDAAFASGELRRLRRAAAADLDEDTALLVADYFRSRGEDGDATALLERVVGRMGDAAGRARLGLADLATSRGDRGAAVRWLEEVVATELGFPGARERLRRLGEAARPGEAGATLLAPEAHAGIGRYVLLRELGRGGAGAVFLARDEKLGREVAVKLHHAGGREARRVRLRAEAEVFDAVRCAGVVRLLDVRPEQGALVFAFCPGGSLRKRIARGDVDPATARGWLADVAAALARMHAAGFVHRDLKPGNVLLGADGRAVVSDLGLARRIGERADAVEGTVGFTAPESAVDSVLRPTLDVFAFGAVGAALGLRENGAIGPLLARCVAEDAASRPADGAALVAALGALPGP